MIHAYNEEYLPDVRDRIGTLFDIACYQKGCDIDGFADSFSASVIASGIENRSPKYLAGMSGCEMSMILFEDFEPEQPPLERSDAFWTGYVLAHLQWHFNRTFRMILSSFPCSRLMELYPTHHEADLGKTVDIVGKHIIEENIIKSRRKEMGMTQKELASLVGISLPTLRSYEQGVIELEDASGRTLYLLGRYLGLTVEEILLG